MKNDEFILKEIIRIKEDTQERLTDKIVNEISFEIFINGKKFISLSSLPSNLIQLAIGFLFTEGLILKKSEIKKVTFKESTYQINFEAEVSEDRIKAFYKTGEKTSGCGSTLSAKMNDELPFHFTKVVIDCHSLTELLKKFQKKSDLFLQTGGVHSAAIVKDYRFVYFAEDIGRHNAVDKVIGMAVEDSYDFAGGFLLSSGRISSEIVKKAIRMKIPMIISQSATTSEAVNLAWKYKIILIGFARAKRFNIYTGFDSIEII